MFRNLPCKYAQEDLKATLDAAGFRGQFDLIYMPRSAVKQSNFGYAYVNFRTPNLAERCLNRLNDMPVHDGRREKICTVSVAHVQGGAEAMPERRRRCKPGCRAEPLIIDEMPTAAPPAAREAACDVAYVKIEAVRGCQEGLPLHDDASSAVPMKVPLRAWGASPVRTPPGLDTPCKLQPFSLKGQLDAFGTPTKRDQERQGLSSPFASALAVEAAQRLQQFYELAGAEYAGSMMFGKQADLHNNNYAMEASLCSFNGIPTTQKLVGPTF